MNQQKQAGKVLEIYYIPGWERSVAIGEAESAEDLVKILNEMPGSGLIDFKIYPLADFDESMKYVIEALKKAEQQFPAPPR
jgi:muconolactone delta-isomerase